MTLDDSYSAPRDLKQVQNTKFSEKNAYSKPSKTKSKRNLADEIQDILNKLHEHPYVQEIDSRKGKLPGIILYTEQQMNELKKLCKSGRPNVIGIDRTFNLSSCYATTLVYHNHDLVRRSSQLPPLFLGPVYLHWDGLYENYHRFFSHLQCHLDMSTCAFELDGGCNIVFGSDEEKAITKALRQCFPRATHTLCVRHLQENISRYEAIFTYISSFTENEI